MTPKPEVKDLITCVGCGECNIVCPVFQMIRLESSGPRGKLFFLTLQKMGQLSETSQELLGECAEAFFNCTLCGMCEEHCEANIPILQHLEEERGVLIEQKLKPKLVQLQERTLQTKNLYGLDNEERVLFSNLSELIERIPNLQNRVYPTRKKSKIVFFLGCLTYFRSEFLKPLEAAIKILEHLGEDYLILGGDEWCCGQPIVAMGLQDKIDDDLKAHNLAVFREVEAETVITNCPGCLTTLKRTYGETNTRRFLHFTEYLDERIGKLSIPIQMKAFYHDPCELALLNGIQVPPRSLAKKIGIELVEIEPSCCGGGGLLRASNAELSKIIARQKIREQELDQHPMITCCPSCIEHFKANGVEAYDLLEVLIKALEGEFNAA